MDFPDVVNIEEEIIEKDGNVDEHQYIVTFTEPVTFKTFERFVESRAYFGYLPLRYGGCFRAVTDQGELLGTCPVNASKETKAKLSWSLDTPRQTWVYQHSAPYNDETEALAGALTPNIVKAFESAGENIRIIPQLGNTLNVLTDLVRAHDAEGSFRRHLNCRDQAELGLEDCFQVDVHLDTPGTTFAIFRQVAEDEDPPKQVHDVDTELEALFGAIDWVVEHEGIPEGET